VNDTPRTYPCTCRFIEREFLPGKLIEDTECGYHSEARKSYLNALQRRDALLREIRDLLMEVDIGGMRPLEDSFREHLAKRIERELEGK